jgi:ABC-2 type transport system permease protein
MFGRILSLVIKELLTIWRDKKTRSLLFIPPVADMIVFTFAATLEVKNVPVGIWNEDRGVEARDLAARIEGSPNFARIVFLGSHGEAARAIDQRQVLMVVHIGPEFSRDLASGNPARVQFLLDGRRSNAGQIVAGYGAEVLARYEQELALSRRMSSPPSTVVARSWFVPNLEATWSTVPGLVAVLSMALGMVITSLSVARERELGSFEQLLVSPLSAGEIMIGKALPAIVVGVGEVTVMILIGVLFYHIPFEGSVGLLYFSMAVYLASIIGVGLFVSALTSTQQQAIIGAFCFIVPAILLSGFASPIENMPRWLQYLTLANPCRHFLVISKGIFLKAMPASEVLANTVPLGIIALVTLSAATWLFRGRTS